MADGSLLAVSDANAEAWAPRVRGTCLVLSGEADCPAGHWLSHLGAEVERYDEMFTALEAVDNDLFGWSLIVIDCDCFGGLDAVRRAVSRIESHHRPLPAILVSSEILAQDFPHEGPVCLRAPLSRLSLRVAVEHALRLRLA